MEIGKTLTDAWDIYLKNFVVIFFSYIIMLVLGICTLGLLLVPLMVGTQMLFVKAKRGEKISIGDIFGPVKRFFALFFGIIWIAILIVIGFVLGIAPGLIFAVWWMFALLSIYDKGLGIGAGMKASKEIINNPNTKNSLWTHYGLMALSYIAYSIAHPFLVIAIAIAAFMLGAKNIGIAASSYIAVLVVLFILGLITNSSAILMILPIVIIVAALITMPLSLGVIACGYADEAK